MQQHLRDYGEGSPRTHFHIREQPEVTRSENRRLWCLSDERNAFPDEELLHKKRCVARCVIVMQKTLSMPIVALLAPDCIA
jgi:hypothetical protein